MGGILPISDLVLGVYFLSCQLFHIQTIKAHSFKNSRNTNYIYHDQEEVLFDDSALFITFM